MPVTSSVAPIVTPLSAATPGFASGCPESTAPPAAASPPVVDLAATSPPLNPSPSATPGGNDRGWPPEALDLAQRLQRSLTINDRQWHRLKAQRSRRAAEQLAAALVQLLAADDPKSTAATPARREAIALVDHALGWLRSEVSDPGCPAHGR